MKLSAFALLLTALVTSSPAAQTKSTRAAGPVAAAVRIDLFSDFQCPACKALHEQTIKRVKEEFATAGKLRLVHHDFPLPQHKHARQAAILAAAADRLGKYDAVADVLFREQESWSQSGNLDAVVDSVLTPEERKKLREIAKDPAILANIERDIQLGERMKVSSTPTMIVTHDGKPNPVVGVVSYTVFSKYLNTIVGQ
jgi:protein-disulfide isomerase